MAFGAPLRTNCHVVLALYRFAAEYDDRVGDLWPSVRLEWQQAASLLPLLFSDTARPWSGRLSMLGYL